MKTLPDYREIELPITLNSLKNYIEPLLCTANIVRDGEEVVGIEFLSEVGSDFNIRVKIKKHQEIELIQHI
jgi:hypothetical protein